MRGFFSFLLLVVLGSSSRAASRPNFLFVFTDDQRHDALSVVQTEQGDKARFPWLRTPHQDRLAKEGIRFRNAFVVNSLCSPSRAVLLTGRYNHENGIASNFRPFPTQTTYATLLQDAGYRTAYVGKWHMGSQRERPGFDEHYSFLGHSTYQNPKFVVNGKDVPKRGWIDDISTDYAVEFIQRQKSTGKPWAMTVGFKSPHGPFEPPARNANLYAGAKAKSVPSLFVAATYNDASAAPKKQKEAEVAINLDYFRCISSIDECLGRLLQALDDTGATENTVVIYSSDNGFYLGEHGLGDKRSAYEESLRVPFLVRAPQHVKQPGSTNDAMVLNLDFAPTLLELAGIAIPRNMQGRSLKPLFNSDAAAQQAWRSSWLYEYFAENQKGSRLPDIVAVRTREAKLVTYPGYEKWNEVYDLKADPYELHNLLGKPEAAQLQGSLEAELTKLKQDFGYTVPDYTNRPPWWGKVEAGGGEKPFALALEGEEAAVGTEIPKSALFDPSGKAWSVEVTATPSPAAGNHVLLAHGGASHGYCLWLNEGIPCFTVNLAGKSFIATSGEKVTWSTLTGKITAEHQAELWIDAKRVSMTQLPSFITVTPREGAEIGLDAGSPVVKGAGKFPGVVRSVKFLSGK
jgi:arylsulfatase A-like enzyme